MLGRLTFATYLAQDVMYSVYFWPKRHGFYFTDIEMVNYRKNIAQGKKGIDIIVSYFSKKTCHNENMPI